MPIAALVTMNPKPGRRDELEKRLAEALAMVRTEPGNLLAMVLRDPSHPDQVFEFAIFQDEGAIEEHWKAEHSVRMTPIISDLLAEPFVSRRFATVDWPVENGVPSVESTTDA